ncbi:MAG: chemotaxis protein CheB [Deltaproteobacteria bacterium]
MARARRGDSRAQRVVGIGASAGGLEPLRQVLAALPTDTGLAIVVLQHLPPSQTGKLAAVLASATKLPVIDAIDGHRVAPNTVVVVPPRTSAALVRGALVLRVATGGGRPRQPIDGLFTSLASALGARAVGVVLSGSANDGTAGLHAIRKAGGMTIVQDPATAQFDEMPRSALADNVAALVLAPAEIGARLAATTTDAPRAEVAVDPAQDTARMLDLLREASGIDFTSYKRSTIDRRLARLLARKKFGSLDEYVTFLGAHPDEVRALYEDLLIHVTEFFRDGTVLDVAAARVAELVASRSRDVPVRVWVPGCSTGEEVYSLAMLLIERLGERRPIQLFGTDLSENAIETARRGRYPATIAARVGAKRIARFFHRDEYGYRIRRDLRERCVFVRHDLVTDPPFSKLDLVSCRNLLIYLGPPLQHRVVPILHYALNQPGLLVLGRAESISGFETLFSAFDADARIFARNPAVRASITFPGTLQLGRLPARRADDPARARLIVQRDVDHLLLSRYAPACIVIDDQLDVVQFRGSTGPYIEQPPGQPQVNLLRMAREELAPHLRLALQRAQRTGEPVRKAGIRLRDRGRTRQIDIEVVPVRAQPDLERHYAVVFEESTPSAAAPAPLARGTSKRDGGETTRLRQELEATKEYVTSISAQHVAASEELGIVNEELQSTNEELQSTNEELQTAKEELQSANEELETVNDELQRGNALLRETNDDLVNVLDSVDIAIIIVDTERRVRRFTPSARAVLKLLPSDIGRPIADLQPALPMPELEGAIEAAIESLAIHDSEVRAGTGACYRMQIRPYRTADRRIDGAVITFVDITELRRSADMARAARDFAGSVVQTVPSPLVVVNDAMQIQLANPAFVAAFDGAGDLHARKLFDLGHWRSDGLADRLRSVFTTEVAIVDLEIEHRGAALGYRSYLLDASPLTLHDGRQLLLLGLADITARNELEQTRRAAEEERDTFFAALSDELRMPLSAILLWVEVLRGLPVDDPRRASALETIAEAARFEARMVDDLLDLALSHGGQLEVELAPIAPATPVRGAITMLRGEADSRGVELVATLDEHCRIAGDARRMQQITAQLISNALAFTAEGGTIEVSLAAANRTVELAVSDNGSGIAPEFLPNVFEPFSQQDRSATRTHRGLGIGLALVRQLVARQHGTITVASALGRGTTFKMQFVALSA